MDLHLDLLDSEERGVPDESDRFMMDPVGFTKELANDWSLPSHIVLFESEERVLREFLLLHSFKEVDTNFTFDTYCLNTRAFSFGLCFFLMTLAIENRRSRDSSMLTSRWIVTSNHRWLSML